MGFAEPTLRLSTEQYEVIVAHCYDGLPDEACGMLIGPLGDDGQPAGDVSTVMPCRNADASAKSYRVDPRDVFRASREAQANGHELIGAWHSHTHTDAYPSLTDVREARDPTWVYAIVSLRHAEPSLRAYRIRNEKIEEVPVEVR